MKSTLLSLLLIAFLTGCATHSREQIAAARAAGVSPVLLGKLEHDRVLLPEDLIELRRHNVADSVPIRHLREVGVDYVAQRDDLRRLRAASVRPLVIDELILASERFVADRYERSSYPGFAWGLSIPFYSWYPYYDYGWGIGYHHYGNGHHDHHDHHDHGHHGHHHR